MALKIDKSFIQIKKSHIMFLVILEYFRTLKYPNFMIFYFFCQNTEKIRPCPGDTENGKFEKSLENKKIKPAFCHFHFLKMDGQISLVIFFTKSYFQENLHFYRGSTILERMSLVTCPMALCAQLTLELLLEYLHV